MTQVVALIHGKEGCYGISFPDFPGVASGGDTLFETLERGREALAVHVAALQDENLPVPDTRSFEAIKADPDLADDLVDVAVVAVVSADLPGRSKRFNISMDERLMDRIDARAASSGESRSAFLAAAARRRLAEEV